MPNNRYQIIPLSNSSTSRIIKIIHAKIDQEGVLTGDFSYNSTQYQALKDRQIAYFKSNDYENSITNQFPEIELEKFELNESESTVKFGYHFDFESDELIQMQGNKLIIDPFLFIQKKANPFKKETRKYPIQFENKSSLTKKVTIEVPEGYVIESIPESLNIKMAGNKGQYKILLSSKGNTIHVMSNLKINKATFSNQDYSIFKQTFEAIVKKENEKIILVKT